MQWQVEIYGEPWTLDRVESLFPEGDCFITHEAGRYSVAWSDSSMFASAADARLKAAEAIEEFFSIGRLIFLNLSPISVGAATEILSSGERKVHPFPVSSTARMSYFVDEPNGSEIRKLKASAMLGTAKAGGALRTAVVLWALEAPNWPRLYRIVEEVEMHFATTIDRLGFCSDAERRRFTHSANSAAVAGNDSRHASGSFAPPKKPLELSEAVEFVRTIVERSLLSNAIGGRIEG